MGCKGSWHGLDESYGQDGVLRWPQRVGGRIELACMTIAIGLGIRLGHHGRAFEGLKVVL